MAGVWLGEVLRDVVYGKIEIVSVSHALLNRIPFDLRQCPIFCVNLSGTILTLSPFPASIQILNIFRINIL